MPGFEQIRTQYTMASIPISTHAVVFHGPWSGMLIEKPKIIVESMAMQTHYGMEARYQYGPSVGL